MHTDWQRKTSTMSTPPALYKTVVVIWTREHPEEQERDLVELAQAAIDGQAYCSRAQTTSIVDPSKDPDWDRTEFFDSGTISPETVPPFRTVTATTLSTAYRTLFPDECTYSQPQITNHEEIMSNWLARYQAHPESALATTNWTGKITQALFHALHLHMPRTKRDRLIALQRTQMPENGPTMPTT